MVTFPFHTVPSKRNMFCAIHCLILVSHAASDQLTRWACLTDMSRTETSSFPCGLESMLLQCHGLLNFPGTLCCCCSLTLSVFFDCCLTASGFRYRRQIDLESLIDSNHFYNQQVDWNSTPFGFVGLLCHVIRASYSLCSRSHHLSPAPPPIPFPFFY